jgi:hypothetical protein
MKIIINLGRDILLLGSVRESIMTPSETSSEKNNFVNIWLKNEPVVQRILKEIAPKICVAQDHQTKPIFRYGSIW